MAEVPVYIEPSFSRDYSDHLDHYCNDASHGGRWHSRGIWEYVWPAAYRCSTRSNTKETKRYRVLKESQRSIYIQRCLARDLSVTPAVRDRSVYSHVTRAVTFWRRGALGKLTCNTCRYNYMIPMIPMIQSYHVI
jgi:hypothetical protein